SLWFSSRESTCPSPAGTDAVGGPMCRQARPKRGNRAVRPAPAAGRTTKIPRLGATRMVALPRTPENPAAARRAGAGGASAGRAALCSESLAFQQLITRRRGGKAGRRKRGGAGRGGDVGKMGDPELRGRCGGARRGGEAK